MREMTEIRWHGRGGQGAKTACLFLAEAAFNSGKDVQGFPEYGPERMGAPITAYNSYYFGLARELVSERLFHILDELLLSDYSADLYSGCKHRSVWKISAKSLLRNPFGVYRIYRACVFLKQLASYLL